MTGWKPVPGHIMTRWAAEVDPSDVLPHYPRPQMVRPEWQNLNGLWDFAVKPRGQSAVDQYEGQILVPFPIESALSGVKRPLLPDERLWYRRKFTIPETWHGQRILLHFGAVDWETTVWVNGRKVGFHQGGYDPFYFEISAYLDIGGDNELVIAVWDPTDQHWQPRGKQTLDPRVIWYTAISGIWQTVWLEPVGEAYIRRLKLTPDIDHGYVQVKVEIEGDRQDIQVHAEALHGDTLLNAASGQVDETLVLPIPDARLWTPHAPHLYDLTVSLRHKAREIDRVESYFGMRKFSLGRDSQGRTRLCLNNQPLFQYGPLDQGYWPDGLYTPPTEEAMLYDIQFCKNLGFNMIRKHIKVEPARYYYHCDRLGLIVWQDMPNGASANAGLASFLALTFGFQLSDRNYKRFGRQDPASRDNFRQELRAMIDALYNVPSIGLWVPFNESWGQFDSVQVTAWLKEYDPTRLVDHASGWYDQGGGDFKSIHTYFRKLKPIPPEAHRAVILSEFGGYSLMFEENAWNPDKVFGYRKFNHQSTLTQAYLSLLQDQLIPWIRNGLSGAVYTQTTDVEIEINGYLTYERARMKMDVQVIQEAHRSLYSGDDL